MFKYFVPIYCALAMININSHDSFRRLDARMTKTNSLVCVGLDPDISKMPQCIMSSTKTVEDKVYDFLCQIIDITAPYSCAFKIQKAFYDELDGGHKLLRDVIAYIHTNYPDIPAFVDCKIGDTDNTMKAYMQNLFDNLKADAVVINPYMGDDVFESFIEDKNKAAIVLVQTSNPNAKVIQELVLESGKQLWEEVLDLIIQRWNKSKNMIVVLSSNTEAKNYASIREKIPQDMPILLAGIGLQGGNPQVLRELLDNNKRGVFVNSSRGILYPYKTTDSNWQNAILQAVVELRDALNAIRES